MALDWAKKQRLMIVLSAVLLVLAIAVIVATLVLYRHPSCVDGKQNQDEQGIDCGGGCTYLCTAAVATPEITFARALAPKPGRTDVIAYVRNKNADAQVRDARYTAEAYDAQGALLGKQMGSIDLPAGATVPLYLPLIAVSGDAARAFVTFDAESLRWTRADDTRPTFTVRDTVVTEGNAPRITATLANPSFSAIYNLKVIATVFAADGTAIGASQTVVPVLEAQGTGGLVFTWNAPFASAVGRVDILPIVPLAP